MLKHAQAAHILPTGAKLWSPTGSPDSLEAGELAEARAITLEEWQDGGEPWLLRAYPHELVALLTIRLNRRTKGVC